MLVSSDTLLNILLPNNNKVLKEVLKEADFKSLEQMVKNSSTSINDVLTELFDDIKNGTKSNTTIENILKNSTIFKDLGSVSNNISTLLENISQDESLSKFKPLIENFLKNIKDMDDNSLKEQIKNSGIFLESKLSSNENSKLQNLVTQIQNSIKEINTPQVKQLNETINQFLQNGSKDLNNLKSILSNLKDLNNSLIPTTIKNLTTITSQLENILNEIITIESVEENSNNLTLQSTKENLNLQTKNILNQLNSEIIKNPVLEKNITPILEKLLKIDNLFVKNDTLQNFLQNNSLSPLLISLKENIQNLNSSNIDFKNLNHLINKLENLIQEQTSNAKTESKISHDMKSILLQMQDEISSKNDIKNSEISKQVDKLLTQIDFYQLNSLVTNSNYVYVPFFWDMLEDGSISMKKKDEEKFYCQINLTLKEFGKVDLMLSLYDKNKLDLTIYAQKEEFKTEIRENMQKLKIALNNANLIPINIKLLDLKEEKETRPEQTYLDNSYTNMNFSSIDIRA